MSNFIEKLRFTYDILYDATVGFVHDDGATHAAAVSYYVFLSIIPIVVLAVSIFSYFFGNTADAYNWVLKQVTAFSPDVVTKYEGFLRAITNEIINVRGTALGFGIISLLWIGMNTICALENTINVVWKINCGRNFFQRRFVSLILITLIGILLYSTTLISTLINTKVSNDFYLLNLFNINVSNLWSVTTHIFSFIVYFLAFLMIYGILPRVKVIYKSLFYSAFFGAITWTLAKILFSWFVVNISQYSKIYGSIAGIMIFMIWLYFSVAIIIYCAELGYSISLRIKHEYDD